MKRIVIETLRNGKKKYVVQSNIILGFIPWMWYTIDYPVNEWGDKVPARFKNLDDAIVVAKQGKKEWSTDVVKKEVIY